MANKVKQIWASGKAVVNGWLAIPSGFSAEVVAQCLSLQDRVEVTALFDLRLPVFRSDTTHRVLRFGVLLHQYIPLPACLTIASDARML